MGKRMKYRVDPILDTRSQPISMFPRAPLFFSFFFIVHLPTVKKSELRPSRILSTRYFINVERKNMFHPGNKIAAASRYVHI